MSLDYKSQMVLYRLINRGIIKRVSGPIKYGKESLVVHGYAKDDSELAIKIHTSRIFGDDRKKSYMFGDWRLRHVRRRINLKTTYVWAEKEYRNLRRLEKYGVRAPKPLGYEANVVVMSFIGKEGVPAPRLISVEEADFDQLSRQAQTLISKHVLDARLVHGDLSPYNMLFWKSKLFVIDLSQAVPLDHPKAKLLFQRDLANLKSFFAARKAESGDYEALSAYILSKAGWNSRD
jgi:RIO kinase 1